MSCERFEREGLLALERGETLDAHFDSCPDCVAARAAYESLEVALAGLHAEALPPTGWEARVWQRVGERPARRVSWLGWWLAVPAMVAAGLVMVVLIQTRSVPDPVGVAVTVRAGEILRRGSEAHPGDRLELEATLGRAAHAELRIYRDDRGPLLVCATEAPCERSGDRLRARFVLPSVGTYQVLLVASDSAPPPAATGTLDGDAGLLLAAGAKVELGPEIEAR